MSGLTIKWSGKFFLLKSLVQIVLPAYENQLPPAENFNETHVRWIYVFVLVFAADLMKKTCKFPLNWHSKNVLFSKQENRLQEKIELIHSVS